MRAGADHLAEIERALAEGDLDRVRELWRGVGPVPADPAVAFRCYLALTEAGFDAEAEALLPTLAGGPLEDQARRLLTHEDGTEDAGQEQDALLDPEVVLPEIALPDREVTSLFLRWFGGRRDLYARQWFDEKRRRTGYHPVREPLTEEVVEAHLAGRSTIGQYLLFPDGSTSFAVLDLDVDASAYAEWRATRDREITAVEFPPLRSWARRIAEAARSLGLPLFAEDSGNKGLHMWLFLSPRRPTRAGRALLAAILAAAGPQPTTVQVEVFPKQERPGPRGLSSLVKLPLGLHRATLRPCPLLDDNLGPIASHVESLRRLVAASDDVVVDVLGRRLVALPLPSVDPGVAGPPPLPAASGPRSLAEALRAIPEGEQSAACERMLGGCRVLRGLVDAAFEKHELRAAESRAILYTVGLVGHAPKLVADVFAAAHQPRAELERVTSGLPSPSGCQRLRSLAPGLCEGCRCPRGRDVQPYATPALFAVGVVGPAEPTWKPFSPWLVEETCDVGGGTPEIEDRLRGVEQRLARIEGGGNEEP